jgi:hypothetical protein
MLPERASVAHAVPVVWTRTTLVAFRFGFSIAVLSVFRLLGFAPLYLQPESVKTAVGTALDPLSFAQARTVLNVGSAVIRMVTGAHGTPQELAGRSSYALLYLVSMSTLAIALTLVWTALDRHRTEYRTLNRWLRVSARYALAIGTMTYALVKVIPTQFGFLTPGELLKPVGQLTRFWVLWDFMAVSTGYTIFAGLVELTGCVLLFFRRTTALGALLLAAALTNVLAMDLAYRVLGAAMVAGVLLALAVVVLAPYAAALVEIFVLGRARALPAEPWTPLSRAWFGPAVTVLLLALLIGAHVPDAMAQRRTYFGRGHGVFGLFEVDRFERAGAAVVPSASDASTWKRVGTDGRYDSGAVTVQFANGDVRQYVLVEDVASRRWTLRARGKDAAQLQYTPSADGALTLDGSIAGEPVHMHLRRIDMSTLPLLQSR